MTLRIWFGRAFGATSILIGLCLLYIPFVYILNLSHFFGTESPWFLVVITGIAVTGLIQLGGGLSKMLGR